MDRYEFVCPCHFGLEAVLKQEILDLVKVLKSNHETIVAN